MNNIVAIVKNSLLISSCLLVILSCASKNEPVEIAEVGMASEQVMVTGMRMSMSAPEEPMPPQVPTYDEKYRDDFEDVELNPVIKTSESPVSTFSADVDTAYYSYVRRSINNGYLPEKSAVRLEEMLNYFDYDYPLPKSAEQPFTASILVHNSPWAKGRKLIHIGIQGYQIAADAQPDSNIVFLLDVSGSMDAPDKLPLVKQSMELLLSQLKPTDTVAIAVYAGAAGTVLPPTEVKDKGKILEAMKKLQAGGSTAGAAGIQLAYELAEQNFKPKAVNRIILATDGDFNVGITDREQLKGFVERKREQGIYLSILGFGQGNYRDHMMQTLAQNGNGIAAYIDTLGEAQKVLVHEATSSLFPIATDLKLQVEFNPKTVSEYRLLGYETRALKREDFNNDKVDAGDIGSGHSVTAIYEIALTGSEGELIDDLRYADKSTQDKSTKGEVANELAFLKIRYKLPGETTSRLMEFPIDKGANDSRKASIELQREAAYAAAVAGFAQILQGGKYLQDWGHKDALELAQENKGSDEYGYRTEFVQLIRKAKIARALE